MKVIAFDYDDTWTVEPVLFHDFATKLKNSGHICICVTSRHKSYDNSDMELPDWMEVIFTGGENKREYTERHHFAFVDIWIDDSPEFI